MGSPIRILVTNDDGVEHVGLHELAVAIEQAGYDTTVVAPSYNASGVGTSLGAITSGQPIELQQKEIVGFSGNVYAFNAPPATCVLAAQLGAFGGNFDIVVSGINEGLNTGRSVLHSGTVGAALAAQNFGLRGLAVSLSQTEPGHWHSAAHSAVLLLSCLEHAAPQCAVNLNVPALPLQDLKGVRWGALAPYNAVRSQISEETKHHVKLTMVSPPHLPAADTDLGLTQYGYAAITSIHAGSEVWSAKVQANDDLDVKLPIPAITAGDRLTAARVYRLRT